MIEGRCVAVLEISAAATLDQQGVTGEDPRNVPRFCEVGVMIVGVPRGIKRPKDQFSRSYRLSLADLEIDEFRSACCREPRFRASERAKPTRSSHVVCV